MSPPGVWEKLRGYLTRADGPLVIRWPALPGLLPWLLRVMWAGHSVARVEATARALSALLRNSPQRHLQHAAKAGVADLVVQRGLLYLYPDHAAFQAEALSWRLRRDNGVQWTESEGPALRELLPDVDPRLGLGLRVGGGGRGRRGGTGSIARPSARGGCAR